MRLLITIIAVVLVFLLIRRLFLQPPPKNSRQASHNDMPQQMVACEICQLHLPKSEALSVEDYFFCSHQHLQEWKNGSSDT